MNIIITAGGTRESIDSVRAITNHATGKLGSLIAKEFAERLAGREHTIYYLCGIGAVIPESCDKDIHIIRIEGTEQLQNELVTLLTTQNIHAVIHSMAVSDYKVNNVTTLEQLAQIVCMKARGLTALSDYEEWLKVISEAAEEPILKDQQKISSELEHPLLLLKKTPKVIHCIKETSPDTMLIGFKLLSGVSLEKLIDTACSLLKRNQCDYVLANDTDTIRDGQHIGYLVDKDGLYDTFYTKEQIAKGIADKVLK